MSEYFQLELLWWVCSEFQLLPSRYSEKTGLKAVVTRRLSNHEEIKGQAQTKMYRLKYTTKSYPSNLHS